MTGLCHNLSRLMRWTAFPARENKNTRELVTHLRVVGQATYNNSKKQIICKLQNG